jgi:RHS repeat-associated protein
LTDDTIGRPIQTALADGRLVASSYDGDSNLTSETLPSLAVHGFSYNPIDQLASYNPPSLGTGTWATQYTYDFDGRPSITTRPDGLTITRAYDSAGRLQTTTYPQGTITRTYSPTTGLLAALAAPSGETLSYTYDGFLRTGVTWTGPVAGAVTFGFDSSLRLASRSVNGQALALGYDADSLLTQSGALTLTRDALNGRIIGTALGSVTDAYTYDSNGLLATYVASYSGNPVYSETVQRDLLGRITQKTETFGSTTHAWGYTFDVSGRLTDVTLDGAFASHYGYDADDNRTTFTNASGSVNPTYDAQDRLLTYGGTSYTYTANGELASKTDATGTTTTTYDVFGNLLHVGLPTGTAIDYVVDGENRRVGKKVNSTLSLGFLYQDSLNVVAQLDGSGNVVARFVFGSNPNVPDYFVNSSGTFRILSDHLGSPRLVVNVATGSVVEEIDFDEFGNVTADTAPGTTPFGFAGGLYDRDTGLVRFGARDYDARVGRWTSKDARRFAGGMNVFGYCYEDPIDLIDIDGLGPIDPIVQYYYAQWLNEQNYYRNDNNNCPAQPPSSPSCQDDGRDWQQDGLLLSAIESVLDHHPVYQKFRGSDGSECAYDSNGNLVNNVSTFNYGPDPGTWSHIIYDVMPGLITHVNGGP